jgi:TolB-like protein
MSGRNPFSGAAKACLFFLCAAVSCLCAPQPQVTIAVCDLTSDGTMSSANVTLISDKISGEISRDNTYTVFDRGSLPFILEHVNMKYSMPCQNVRRYSELGKQIGADQIVEGTVSLKKGELRVTLLRVDVKKGRLIREVKNAMTVNKDDFVAHVLPTMVKDLMSVEDSQASGTGKKGFFGRSSTWIGASTVVAAAVVGTYFLVSSKGPGQAASGDFLLDPPKHSP